jgi:hypothetical protein
MELSLTRLAMVKPTGIKLCSNKTSTYVTLSPLSAHYWAEALNTATYLLNRLPFKTVYHPILFFALSTTTPSYEHLWVFGCAYYPNTSTTTPHKLAPHSSRCLFLGYSSNHKVYQCLNLLTHHIITYHHVVFDEYVFPLADFSPPFDLDSRFDDACVVVPLPLPSFTSHASMSPAPHAIVSR